MNKTSDGRTLPVLLGTQATFNIGFYTVVPFLAIALRENFLLSSTMIGLILGLRTFCQQGMFLFGGALTDRLGGKRIILIGCAVRLAGYLLLALAAELPLMVAGVILTGVGGALFSPALETLLSYKSRERRTAFAALAIFGEFGAIIGSLVGAFLFSVSFAVTVWFGIAVFVLATILLVVLLPSDQAGKHRGKISWHALRDRTFLLFATLYSVNLLAYNQLYLGLPAELGNAAALGGLFALVSVITIVFQLPLAKLTRIVGESTSLRLGFGVMALAFALPVVLTSFIGGMAAAVLLVVLLMAGNLMVTPLALSVLPRYQPGKNHGCYYGLLASFGGLAVLAGNILLGMLTGNATGQGSQAPAWIALAVLAVISAAFIPYFLPSAASKTQIPKQKKEKCKR